MKIFFNHGVRLLVLIFLSFPTIAAETSTDLINAAFVRYQNNLERESQKIQTLLDTELQRTIKNTSIIQELTSHQTRLNQIRNSRFLPIANSLSQSIETSLQAWIKDASSVRLSLTTDANSGTTQDFTLFEIVRYFYAVKADLIANQNQGVDKLYTLHLTQALIPGSNMTLTLFFNAMNLLSKNPEALSRLGFLPMPSSWDYSNVISNYLIKINIPLPINDLPLIEPKAAQPDKKQLSIPLSLAALDAGLNYHEQFIANIFNTHLTRLDQVNVIDPTFTKLTNLKESVTLAIYQNSETLTIPAPDPNFSVLTFYHPLPVENQTSPKPKQSINAAAKTLGISKRNLETALIVMVNEGSHGSGTDPAIIQNQYDIFVGLNDNDTIYFLLVGNNKLITFNAHQIDLTKDNENDSYLDMSYVKSTFELSTKNDHTEIVNQQMLKTLGQIRQLKSKPILIDILEE